MRFVTLLLILPTILAVNNPDICGHLDIDTLDQSRCDTLIDKLFDYYHSTPIPVEVVRNIATSITFDIYNYDIQANILKSAVDKKRSLKFPDNKYFTGYYKDSHECIELQLSLQNYNYYLSKFISNLEVLYKEEEGLCFYFVEW